MKGLPGKTTRATAIFLAGMLMLSFAVFLPLTSHAAVQNNEEAAEAGQAGAYNGGFLGGAYNNPVSQWIVLSGLFNPYSFGGGYGGGGYGGGYYGTPYYNPISQWIVLGGLFNPYMAGYGGVY